MVFIYLKKLINEVVLSKILRKTKLSLSLPELWFNLLLCTLLCYPNQTFEKNNFILILKGVFVSFYWFGNSNETTGRTKCSALKWKNKITPKKKRVHYAFTQYSCYPYSLLSRNCWQYEAEKLIKLKKLYSYLKAWYNSRINARALNISVSLLSRLGKSQFCRYK